MKVIDNSDICFDEINQKQNIEEAVNEINLILDNFNEAVEKRKARNVTTIKCIKEYSRVIEVEVSKKTAILVNDIKVMRQILNELHMEVYNIYVYNLSAQLLNDEKFKILIYIK